MKTKSLAALLALFLGVLGIHRFYLGQYLRGAIYIVYPVLLLTGIFFLTGTMSVIREQGSLGFSADLLLFILPFYILPIVDAIFLFSMSKEKFNDKFNKNIDRPGKAFLYSLLVFFIAIGVDYFILSQFYVEKKVDVQSSAPTHDLTSTKLANEFAVNDSIAQQNYGKSVITLKGIVIEEELDPIFETRSLVLKGNDQLNVKCNFADDHQEKVKQIQLGEEIELKGAIRELLNDEILLDDCLLVAP